MSSATSRAGIRTPVVRDEHSGLGATSPAAQVKPAVPGAVVTEDGRVFRGTGFGAVGTALGEGVFATGMTGYQETLTDPSYHRQIVVMTAPHVGNTGIVGEDAESSRIWVAGFVVRDLSPVASNWRAERTLSDELADAGVVGVAGVDTRALTRHLRSAGAMRMGLFTGPDAEADEQLLVERVRQAPAMLGADLTGDVSAAEPYVVPAIGKQVARVAAVDLGIKAMTPHRLAERGCEVTVVPASIRPDELLGLGADGIFFSNGPGDPATAEHAVDLMRAALASGTPVFGICFGNQILGRALGFGTYKLRFGHRGINQPVLDRRTGKVEITAHNHGFAVDADPDVVAETEFGRVEVSHVCLNDGVVEGLRCLDRPAFSVQYHPEAAAGPHDADYLFDEFVQAMTGTGDQGEGDADASS